MTTRIVFVCEGNVCRSPMAEALLKDFLLAKKIDGVEVSSCGLRAQDGANAHSELESVIGEEAYRQLSNFNSRTISEKIVGEADYLLAMEDRHVRDIKARFPEAKGKTFTIMEFAGAKGEIKDFIDSDLPDIVDWMQDCYIEMSEVLPKVAERITSSKYTVPKKSSKDSVNSFARGDT